MVTAPALGLGEKKQAERLTGLKWTSLARPSSPIIEMAWSMPPDSVPTNFSHSAVNCATSCMHDAAQLKHLCLLRQDIYEVCVTECCDNRPIQTYRLYKVLRVRHGQECKGGGTDKR